MDILTYAAGKKFTESKVAEVVISGGGTQGPKGEKGEPGRDGTIRYINVMDYATGNGTTDDITALNLAHSAALSVGKPLYFPRGTYRILSGFTTTVSIFAEVGAVLKCDTNGMDLVLVINASNVTVDGLTFDGNSKANRGIRINQNCKHVAVRNNEIKFITQTAGVQGQSVGIWANGGADHLLVEGNYVHHVSASYGTGISRGILISKSTSTEPDTTDVLINGNRIEEITSNTGVPDVFDSDGIVIQDIHVNTNDTYKSTRANVRITNNYMYRCQKRGMKLQSPGCLATGNIIDMAKDVYSFSGVSIFAPDITFSNNQIYITSADANGIEIVAPVGMVVSNMIVSNNIIQIAAGNTSIDGIRVLNNVSSLSITNNQITNGRYAIHFNVNSNGIVCSYNIIKRPNYAGIILDRITADTGVYPTNVSICGNMIDDGQTNGVEIKGGTKVAVVGNVGTVKWSMVEDTGVVGVVKLGNVT